MNYAVIMAGGSGTRLWPMSRADQPKQLIPFINGRSLLQVAVDRLKGLVPPSHQFICAGEKFRGAIRKAMPGFTGDRILGEPEGRDTLAAVGFPAAILARRDPEAALAVFTADHLIEPVSVFQKKIRLGFRIAHDHPRTLVTFGIEPTFAATAYGYVQLGSAMRGAAGAFAVRGFKEKPDDRTARKYLASGKYLWNSGMFVWRAATLLECIGKHQPQVHAGLMEIAGAWGTRRQEAVLRRVYPKLQKISVDYAIMEPASRDKSVRVACVKMPLKWLDVGSWPQYGQTLAADEHGNRVAVGALLMDSRGTLVASSDHQHVVATIGVEDLIIVHSDRATLVCRRDAAGLLKELHQKIGQRFGEKYL